MDYEVRSYRPGDEEQIVPLLQLVFDGWRDIDFWRWKYLDNPSRKAIMVVAEIDDRIIGFSGSIFKPVNVGDNIMSSAYGTDMAVHPDFRRRRVRTNMIALKTELRYQEGEHIDYSATENPIIIQHPPPNRLNFPYFLRRFIRIRDIGLHNRMNPTDSLSAYIKRLGLHTIKLLNDLRNTISPPKPPNEDIEIYEIDEFDYRADKFWDKVSDHYDFIVERKREHLNWSYCDSRGGDFMVKVAEENGRMLGYSVLRVIEPRAYPRGEVIDLLTVPGRMDAADALVADATGVFDENEINMCFTILLEGHPYERVFERYGFFNGRRTINVYYICYHMDDVSVELVRKIIETADIGKVHLAWGDLS